MDREACAIGLTVAGRATIAGFALRFLLPPVDMAASLQAFGAGVAPMVLWWLLGGPARSLPVAVLCGAANLIAGVMFARLLLALD